MTEPKDWCEHIKDSRNTKRFITMLPGYQPVWEPENWIGEVDEAPEDWICCPWCGAKRPDHE